MWFLCRDWDFSYALSPLSALYAVKAIKNTLAWITTEVSTLRSPFSSLPPYTLLWFPRSSAHKRILQSSLFSLHSKHPRVAASRLAHADASSSMAEAYRGIAFGCVPIGFGLHCLVLLAKRCGWRKTPTGCIGKSHPYSYQYTPSRYPADVPHP